MRNKQLHSSTLERRGEPLEYEFYQRKYTNMTAPAPPPPPRLSKPHPPPLNFRLHSLSPSSLPHLRCLPNLSKNPNQASPSLPPFPWLPLRTTFPSSKQPAQSRTITSDVHSFPSVVGFSAAIGREFGGGVDPC